MKIKWFEDRNHKGQIGIVSLCSRRVLRGVWWKFVEGAMLLSIFISDVEAGPGGKAMLVASDTELLGKADGSKPQKDLRTLSDKMTDEIQWR